jgi:hypothetical protein
MSGLRWVLVCGVIAVFLALALRHDDPLVLLVGLFPVAWVAVELVWKGFKP